MNKKVVFELKNKSLGEGLNKLGKLSGFRVAYTLQQVNPYKSITIERKSRSVEETLNLLLANSSLSFLLKGQTIMIIDKSDANSSNNNQTIEITGTVISDEDQAPMIGAYVIAKDNPSLGTTTDVKGHFKLQLPGNVKTLLVSFIGKEKLEVDVANNLKIYLKDASRSINEVVVIGYGTQRASLNTGSISKVNTQELVNSSATSIDQELAGRAPGLQVTVSDGNTNSTPRIRIRGVNSINNSCDPLFVVDGVPISSGDIGGNTATNTLADINPSDIESIDVLKDGAASAIYGSRAANGVILITTKHGTKGKVKVTYNAYASMSNLAKKIDLLNAQQFVEIANEKYTNSGVTTNPAVYDGVDTDWQSLVYNKHAFSQSHSVSISGASDKTNYFFSVNYLSQKGSVLRNTSSRYGFRANIDHQLNKLIKLGTNTSFTRVKNVGINNDTGLSTVVINALIALPNVSPYDSNNSTGYNIAGDGKSLGAGSNLQTIDDAYPNILFSLYNDQYNIEKYRILNTTYAELSLFKGLKFRSQAGVDVELANDFYSLDARSGDGYSYNGLVKNTSITRGVYNLQNYFSFNKTWKKHSFDIMAGTEIQKNTYKSSMAGGSDFSSSFFQTKNLITGTYSTTLSGGSYTEGSFISYFSRLNYNYAGKYLLGLTIRRDGLSSLSEDHRFGTFPGISAGWRISDEDFWKDSQAGKIVNSLKISGSYGKVGNALTGFPYLTTYGASLYGSENGVSISNVGNSSLTWETSKKYDAKLDAAFLNDRFSFTFDWFKNNVDNLVMDVTYPNSFGIPDNEVARNIGAMTNQGFEINLSAEVIKKRSFTWDINANYTSTKNKVTKLYNDQSISSGSNIIAEGLALNTMIGYRYAGVNEATGNPMYYKADGLLVQGNIADQKYYYATSKQDGTLGTATTLTDADKVNLGSPTPTWYGGLTNTFTYRQFALDIFFRFSGGNKIYNSMERTLLNQKFKNNGTLILNRWTPTNTKTDIPKLYYGRESFINLTPSSRWMESGDYLKLQSVNFSYSFTKKFLEKCTKNNIASLKVYVQGQNLFTCTKYTGYDPDLISEIGTGSTQVPPSRVFSFGLNVGF